MKPVAFDVRTPSTLRGALDELAAAGEDGRALAGGQSLIPLLNFRMSQPEVLVDLGGIPELRYIRSDDDGGLRIGAMTTQTALLKSDLLRAHHPVVSEAIGHVAHTPIRNRGTIGGSLAHADPSAELPAIALLVDAVLVATSVSGSREIPAAEFFLGPYMTALEEGELLTEVRLPPPVLGQGAAVYEMANRRGDFALAGAGAWVRPDGAGRVSSLKVVAFAASNSPTVLPGLDAFAGRPLDDELPSAVAAEYVANIVPVADLHGTAEYRRHLVGVVVTRALEKAVERATD